MTEIERKQADEKGNSGKQWKSIYSLGGAAIKRDKKREIALSRCLR